MIAAPEPKLLASGTATITTGYQGVTLEESIVIFTDHTAGGQTINVIYVDARPVVDGARYPALAAVWENPEDDAAFADL